MTININFLMGRNSYVANLGNKPILNNYVGFLLMKRRSGINYAGLPYNDVH